MFRTSARRMLPNRFARFFGVKSARKYTVAVEGNIASGKTSLLQYFERNANVEVHAEPVEKWRNIDGHNALAKMYEDPKRWGLTLQTYVQLTMMETHLIKQTKAVKMMERSVFSAKFCFVENLYKSGLMPEIEYIVLSRWFGWITENMDCNIDLIVYLRTDPKTVHERIKKRGRREEKPVPLEYLESLHHLHEDWLVNHTQFSPPCPVLILDANQDQEGVRRQIDEHRSKILFGYDEALPTQPANIREHSNKLSANHREHSNKLSANHREHSNKLSANHREHSNKLRVDLLENVNNQ